jgi:hypothetical protein
MSATRTVPSTEVCRPRKSPATFGSAPPSSRHTRYDARPRVKVTGVLSPERRPRDTKGAQGGIRDEAAGYSGIPQLSANLRDRNRRIRWGIERVLQRNGLNQVNPVHFRDRVAFWLRAPATMSDEAAAGVMRYLEGERDYPLNLRAQFTSPSDSRARGLRSPSRVAASSSDGTQNTRACLIWLRPAMSPSGGRVGLESATIARAD